MINYGGLADEIKDERASTYHSLRIQSLLVRAEQAIRELHASQIDAMNKLVEAERIRKKTARANADKIERLKIKVEVSGRRRDRLANELDRIHGIKAKDLK